MFVLFDLFFLSRFATTLLRLSAAIVFLLLAWTHYRERSKLAQIPFIVVGKGSWIPLLAAFFEAVVGTALFVGIYTQAAALFGALFAIKHLVWRRRYPAFFPLSSTACGLLLVICLSLVVTGAGALAFDLPL